MLRTISSSGKLEEASDVVVVIAVDTQDSRWVFLDQAWRSHCIEAHDNNVVEYATQRCSYDTFDCQNLYISIAIVPNWRSVDHYSSTVQKTSPNHATIFHQTKPTNPLHSARIAHTTSYVFCTASHRTNSTPPTSICPKTCTLGLTCHNAVNKLTTTRNPRLLNCRGL